ncbi:MAG: hypothetical protein OHK0038_15610 [Flammeovirgaceae bacterium]
MKFDDNKYAATPLKATYLKRDYSSLPSKASLKAFCPIPQSQGNYGTCVGWSSSWAARTIIEAKEKGWTDKNTITQNAFAPGFTYFHVKDQSDSDCSYGTWIDDALNFMKTTGAVKYSDFDESCPTYISSSLYNKAKDYKIKDYVRLFSIEDGYEYKIRVLKKALAEGNPVVIGMKCPDSFSWAKGAWKPTESPYAEYGGHAMCVIGYDDNQYGGAFEIQNSWGKEWGNGGFIWVDYQTFHNFVKYGFEVVGSINNINPTTKSDLKGELRFILSDGTEMIANRSNSSTSHYKMQETYTSGTRFRMYISNNEPAYVYAIGSDLSEEITIIFPPKEHISPLLSYKSNNVAIPDENYFIEFDNNEGTDFMCVLYSKEPIDIKNIINRLENTRGSFIQKINSVLKNQLVNPSNITFQSEGIGFSANSEGKNMVAIIVEINHQ